MQSSTCKIASCNARGSAIMQPGQTLCDHVIKIMLTGVINLSIIIFQTAQLNQFCASLLFSQMASLSVSPCENSLVVEQ